MNTTQPSIEVVSVIGGDTQWLVTCISRMLPLLPMRSHGGFARISTRIVHDDEMTQMHAQHSKVATTTDVLTFVSQGDHGLIEVDLALCVDEAARRSAEFGHRVNDELALYALHGLLHAVGYEDHDAATAHDLHTEEDRIMSALGITVASALHKDDR